MTFDQAFEDLLGHEGGYSNRSSDPGGETMWGVTIKVARANGYSGAMKDLPRALAGMIYRREYWDRVQADKLPESIRFDVFDAAVNSGVKQAVLWLQRACGAMDDGSIGPATIKAANENQSGLSARFNGLRLVAMTNMPAWDSSAKGWARRIGANLQRQV